MNKSTVHYKLWGSFVYQLVVLRVIGQNCFVFEGSGGKSKDWQGEREIVQVVENCSSSWTKAQREGRQEGGMTGERRMGSKMVIPTSAKDSRTQIAKWVVQVPSHSLTKVAGREAHIWGYTLVHGRSDQKTMLRLQRRLASLPQFCHRTAHHQQDTNWAFVLLFSVLSLLPLHVFWLDMSKICSHSAWGLQTQYNANKTWQYKLDFFFLITNKHDQKWKRW